MGPQNPAVRALSKSARDSFDESSEWYAYASTEHFWFRWRLEVLRRLLGELGLPRREPLRVLDLGCGRGVLITQLERLTDWVVDGADLSMTALKQVPRGRGDLFYYDVLDERDELLGAYDVVLLLDVLEHILDTKPFLSSAIRHVRPGGHLLVNVPALQRFYSPYDEAVGHLRRYDKPTLAREFAGQGLERLQQRYWGFSMLPLLALRAVRLRLSSSGRVLEKGIQPPAWLNAPLWLLGKLETAVWRRPFLGTSLLLAGRRPARAAQ